MNPLKMALHWQIILAIALATLTGLSITEEAVFLGVPVLEAFSFVGTLFLNALKMLIVPLVTASIICGVSGLGAGGNVGRLGGKTIGFYMFSSLVAILVGLVVVNVMTPGLIDGKAAGEALNLSSQDELAATLSKVEGRSGSDVVDVFLRMVPANIISAAAQGQMLGLIVFSMLFGFFMTRIEGAYQETLQNFWQGVFAVMMQMTMFVMKFAPLGVYALVAKTVTSTGLDAFGPLLVFFFSVVIALFIHAFITLAMVLKTAGVNPIKHYKVMAPVMLTAFSTASSSATLPMTMDTVEKGAGVSNKTSSFTLPLGATINMDGTALYECVAAMFIAQAYGLDLGFGEQFTIVLVALLTSIGVAGIPAASLVAITVILAAIGLPLEGIGLLLVTDRVLDMLRTAVNVFSDSVCAVVVARSEGESTQLL